MRTYGHRYTYRSGYTYRESERKPYKHAHTYFFPRAGENAGTPHRPGRGSRCHRSPAAARPGRSAPHPPGSDQSTRRAPRLAGVEEMRGAPRAYNPAGILTLPPQKYPPPSKKKKKKPESRPKTLLFYSPRGVREQRGSPATPPKFPRRSAGSSGAVPAPYPAGGAESRGGLETAAAAARGRGGFLGATTPRQRPGEPRACGAAASGQEKRK